MCKLTKNLLIQGVDGFSGFRGEDFTRGEEIQGIRMYQQLFLLLETFNHYRSDVVFKKDLMICFNKFLVTCLWLFSR